MKIIDIVRAVIISLFLWWALYIIFLAFKCHGNTPAQTLMKSVGYFEECLGDD